MVHLQSVTTNSECPELLPKCVCRCHYAGLTTEPVLTALTCHMGKTQGDQPYTAGPKAGGQPHTAGPNAGNQPHTPAMPLLFSFVRQGLSL